MTGIEMIASERERQIALGWTPEHDTEHGGDELLKAANCYVGAGSSQSARVLDLVAKIWPWGMQDWKPSNDRVHNLAKAGALIAAEMDRLMSSSATPNQKENHD